MTWGGRQPGDGAVSHSKKGERWVIWNGLGSQKQRLWLQGTQQARNTALALPGLPVHSVEELTVCDREGSLERMRVRQQEISENFSLLFIILGYFAFWISLRIKNKDNASVQWKCMSMWINAIQPLVMRITLSMVAPVSHLVIFRATGTEHCEQGSSYLLHVAHIYC